jgi:hypothetical protein
MSATFITVVGTFENMEGVPVEGSVTFQLNSPSGVQNLTASVIYTAEPIVVPLDASSGKLGSSGLGVILLANNDAATYPAGTQYIVTEETTGVANYSYNVTLNAAGASVVDLAALRPT